MKATEPLSDLAFAGLVVRTIGPVATGRLMLFCTVWALMGLHTFRAVDEWAADMKKQGGPSRAGIYRALADLKKVHAALAKAEGRSLTDAPTLEQLAQRLGRATARAG